MKEGGTGPTDMAEAGKGTGGRRREEREREEGEED